MDGAKPIWPELFKMCCIFLTQLLNNTAVPATQRSFFWKQFKVYCHISIFHGSLIFKQFIDFSLSPRFFQVHETSDFTRCRLVRTGDKAFIALDFHLSSKFSTWPQQIPDSQVFSLQLCAGDNTPFLFTLLKLSNNRYALPSVGQIVVPFAFPHAQVPHEDLCNSPEESASIPPVTSPAED